MLPVLLYFKIMPRFRNRLGTQIHSIKHVIDSEGLVTTSQSRNVIANAVVQRNAVFNPTEVEVGETVNGFYITLFIIGNTGAPITSSINWYIIKTRAGQTTVPNAFEVGTSEIRNQVFHQEKGLAGSGDGTAMAFKGVIVVPKGMRRTREGDQFEIVIQLATTSDARFCLQAIYKSFS